MGGLWYGNNTPLLRFSSQPIHTKEESDFESQEYKQCLCEVDTREETSLRLCHWHRRVMRPMTTNTGCLCLLLLMTRKTRIHRQRVRCGPDGGSIGLLARNGEVTLHTISLLVVVMRELDIGQGTREPQDLAVFTRVALSALQGSFGDGQLRVTIPDFCMAFNTFLV